MEQESRTDLREKEGQAARSKPDNRNRFEKIRDFLLSRYLFRLNTISNEVEYTLINKADWVVVNPFDLSYEIMEELAILSADKILHTLLRSSKISKPFNPITEYFRSLPDWTPEQPDYIKELSSYVQTTDQKWWEIQFTKFLVRSIACSINKIPFNKQCLTLLSDQNDGKSSFLRFLCPPSLSDYYTENIDLLNKDGRFALCQNFLINLDELAGFKKYDIKQIKALISRDKLKDRLPYDPRPQVFPRVANFVGSTNSEQFLTDETGNVRWLIFEIKNIKHDNGGENGYSQKIDIDKVYAQAYYLLKSGFDFRLSKDEIVIMEEKNANHLEDSLEADLIDKFLSPGSEIDYDTFLNSTDIKLKIENLTRSRISINFIGKALKKLKFAKTAKYNKESRNTKRGYFVKIKEVPDNPFTR